MVCFCFVAPNCVLTSRCHAYMLEKGNMPLRRRDELLLNSFLGLTVHVSCSCKLQICMHEGESVPPTGCDAYCSNRVVQVRHIRYEER